MTHKLKIFCLAILLGSTAMLPLVKADEWKKETMVTFSAPVAVPGQVLPPGRYIFKLADADSHSDRQIVQIFSEHQSDPVATILAIPAYRLKPSDDTLITFEERPSGSPSAVKRLFCPGDLGGVAFMYPEDQR
jgi:hypothetical protein